MKMKKQNQIYFTQAAAAVACRLLLILLKDILETYHLRDPVLEAGQSFWIL